MAECEEEIDQIELTGEKLGAYAIRTPHRVNAVVIGKEMPPNEKKVQELRDQIFSDYKDTVFRDKIWPNPPIRNSQGLAKIELKPGVVPVKQKPFVMIGERIRR